MGYALIPTLRRPARTELAAPSVCACSRAGNQSLFTEKCKEVANTETFCVVVTEYNGDMDICQSPTPHKWPLPMAKTGGDGTMWSYRLGTSNGKDPSRVFPLSRTLTNPKTLRNSDDTLPY